MIRTLKKKQGTTPGWQGTTPDDKEHPGRQGTPRTTRNDPRNVPGLQKNFGKVDKKQSTMVGFTGWVDIKWKQKKTKNNNLPVQRRAVPTSRLHLKKTSPKKIWKSREKTTISHGRLLRWEDMKWEQKKKKNNNLPVQRHVDAKAGCPANRRPRLDAQRTGGQGWTLEEESDDNNKNQPV